MTPSKFETAVISQPVKPYCVIAPTGKWVAVNLVEFWQYHELLFFLTLRDVKIRYKQTALGVIWAVLQPLLTMLVFAFLFGRVAKMPSEGVPYPLFAYAGLLPWTYFANGVTTGSNALVSNSNLVGKVYFPRLIMPAAAVLSGLVDLGVAFVLLIGLFAYYHVGLTWNLIVLPLLVLLATLLTLGIGLFLSALNVKYRDIRHAVPFFIQLALFATPVIYPMSAIPQRWRWLIALNPMAGVVEGFRRSLLGGRMDWAALLQSTVVTILLVIGGALYFRSMEKSFADVI
jgi:lipopolysaccharide transport system permease protein